MVEFLSAERCDYPPFEVKEKTDVVFTLPNRPGLYFVCAHEGDAMVVVSLRQWREPAFSCKFADQPSGLRGYALEQWAMTEMEHTAKLRMERPELRPALHARDMYLRRLIAEACQQKVIDQNRGGDTSNRQRKRELTAVLGLIDFRIDNAFAPDAIEALHDLRAALKRGEHHAEPASKEMA